MVTETSQVNFVPLDHPLGRRISIIGGGGKTTLARALSAKMGIPFVELDALFWLPGWVQREDEEFRRLVAEAIGTAGEGWVVDGNYTSRLDGLVIGQADTVVWVNLPWRVRFWRIFKRSFQRAWDKQLICGENRESMLHNLGPKSLWWWYVMNRKRIMAAGDRMLSRAKPGVPVINIRSPRDLDAFYELQGLNRD